MELPHFFAHRAPRVFPLIRPLPPSSEKEAKFVVEAVAVTHAVMPDLRDLFIDSVKQLSYEIWVMRENVAPLRDIDDKVSLLAHIRYEARLGDGANERLAKALALRPGRDIVQAVAEEVARPIRSFSKLLSRPSLYGLVRDHHRTAENLVVASLGGVSHRENLAAKAVELFQRLTV